MPIVSAAARGVLPVCGVDRCCILFASGRAVEPRNARSHRQLVRIGRVATSDARPTAGADVAGAAELAGAGGAECLLCGAGTASHDGGSVSAVLLWPG